MRALPLMLLALTACGDPGGDGTEQEVITTVTLTFTPATGPAVVAVFDDPDGDGGEPPVIDPVNLAAHVAYTLTIDFENRLETPPEVITDEVRDEGASHQIFLTGTAVDGPAANHPGAPLSHTYGDEDGSGLPLGLTNEIATVPGTGQLTVTLRHMPPLNDTPVKTSSSAMDVMTGGFAAIGGTTDSSSTFDLTVP